MDFTSVLSIIVGIIFVFAIFDLVVGVSNDAINFLSPSIGSNAGSYKKILIIASLGLLAGAIFSSGLMEVARKGIFHPQHFNLIEIIMIFLAVIIADILLLNKFNSLGMPTSTTVSIVFCLLGSAVGIGVLKLHGNDALPMSDLATYINTAKVLTIIGGILGSVVASFILGALIQYITRMFFTFDYTSKPKYWSAILGAIAITAITHFILAKGLKGSALPNIKDIITWINSNLIVFLSLTAIAWFLVLQVLLWFKVNVFKIIVLIGTFSLAMAFAGNDLVNFIGVPLAALKSYQLFLADATITDPSLFFMDGLNKKEQANIWLLLLAGAIMVATLVFSVKAKKVLATGLNLSRQSEGQEDFGTSLVARGLVRKFRSLLKYIEFIIPAGIWKYVGKRFKKVKNSASYHSFDLVRASVILICSSILISIATAYKLPLSTTYVTFMVAMGAAFADRAWGRESAVYRVNGVISVIFGWFLTAFGAFVFAYIIATIIYFGKVPAIAVLTLATLYIMIKPLFTKKKKAKLEDDMDNLEDADDMPKVFLKNISKNLKQGQKYFSSNIECLAKEDVYCARTLHEDIASFKDNTYKFKKDFISKIGDSNNTKMGGVKSLSSYVGILNSLKGYSKSLKSISETTTQYIDNNHEISALEIKSFKKLNTQLAGIYDEMFTKIKKRDFDKKFKNAEALRLKLQKYIQQDMERVQSGKVSVQSSVFYISLLNEVKHLLLEINAIHRRCWELDLKK